MDTLRKGCTGPKVVQLQELLEKKQFPVSADGIFGQQTYLAVCRFQEQNGLSVDGIVGEATWNALLKEEKNPETQVTEDTEEKIKSPVTSVLDFESAAKILGTEIAVIRAVHEVESGGRSGFLKDGRPIILFEGHIFWDELEKRNVDPKEYAAENSDILFPEWDKNSYKGASAEYERLDRACAIHEEAALSSASWGMFQIMRFNYKSCGYDSVNDYVEAIRQDANNHLLAFVRFLQNTGMDAPLRELDWATFACRYNGPGYKQNQYNIKLESAYRKYKYGI